MFARTSSTDRCASDEARATRATTTSEDALVEMQGHDAEVSTPKLKETRREDMGNVTHIFSVFSQGLYIESHTNRLEKDFMTRTNMIAPMH